MRLNKLLIFIIITIIAFSGCEESKDESDDGGITITENIRFPDGAPQLFSLTDEDFIDATYDIYLFEVFDPTDPDASSSYPFVSKIGLNTAAAVTGISMTGSDFLSAVRPDSGYNFDDSSNYVIGSSWYGQYDGVTHYMAGDSTIYFIFTAQNEWVKMEVLKASTSFFIQYAIDSGDGKYSATDTVEIPFNQTDHIAPGDIGTMSEPTFFSFSNGQITTPEAWHIGFGNLLNFSVELQSLTYVPTALINFDLEVEVAVITGETFEEIIDVPANAHWWTTESDIKKLWSCAGDGVANLEECANAVLIYDFPTYNSHFMQVLNPDGIYLIRIDNNVYKIRLEEDSYSSSNDGQLIWFMYEKII